MHKTREKKEEKIRVDPKNLQKRILESKIQIEYLETDMKILALNIDTRIMAKARMEILQCKQNLKQSEQTIAELQNCLKSAEHALRSNKKVVEVKEDTEILKKEGMLSDKPFEETLPKGSEIKKEEK